MEWRVIADKIVPNPGGGFIIPLHIVEVRNAVITVLISPSYEILSGGYSNEYS